MMEFTFIGVWDDPADLSLITPTYVTTVPPRFAAATLTLGSFVPKISSLTIESGNSVYLRPDATDDSGYAYACVQDRVPKITMDPEDDLIANRDWMGLWKAGTAAVFTATLGTTGNQITFSAPVAQIINTQESERSGLNAASVDFQCNKSSSLGDDELTLAYA
jgi:hypothetical protein